MDKLDIYIKQARHHGQSDEQIHADLVEAGWDSADIHQGLARSTASKHHQGTHKTHGHHQDQPEWKGAAYAYSQAIEAIQRNSNPALFYIGVSAIATIVANLIINKSFLIKQTHESAIAIVNGIVGLLLLPLSVRYPLALARAKKATISQLLTPDLSLYGNLIMTFILVIVLLVVGALPLLIPLIWILPWSWFMFLIVADLHCGASAALQEARRLTANNKGKAWGIIGISVLLVLVSGLLSRVPILGSILSPTIYILYYTATAFLYIWLRDNVTS
jgi:hypothetical protein